MISCLLEFIVYGKKKLINWMNPQPHNKLVDVASGTGDIAKSLFQRR